MVLEYLLVLTISVMILAGSFGLNGPVKMLSLNGSRLAHRLERRTITGYGFFSRDGGTDTNVSWRIP